MILVESQSPCAFFAYPGKESVSWKMFYLDQIPCAIFRVQFQLEIEAVLLAWRLVRS